MNSRTARMVFATAGIIGALACGGGGVRADESAPLTPELAAKRHMVQKQQDQRITDDKRRAAAEALKAERARVYKARQAAEGGLQGVTPLENENK